MADRLDETLKKRGRVGAVAFLGGSETANMVERARRAGLPVWEVDR